jgi:hypothetical protein
MNEHNSGAALVESTALPMPYKDRSAGLVVFGILTILLGCLAGLFVPLMLFGAAASAKATGAPAPFSTLLPAASIYGILAVALVWLGIGSIMARRWARALMLVFSWAWLIIGVLSLLFLAFMMPQMMANVPATASPGQTASPSTIKTIVMIVTFLVLGVLFVILPAIWTFFYNSRHVKATCEARDPVTRWTDACPLPVLGLCLFMMVSVPMMLIMAFAGHAVVPFFGVFLLGAPGALFWLGMAAFWCYACWSLYKLEQQGWWLLLIASCVWMVSSLLTFARHDMMELYRLMDYSEAQMELMRRTGFLSGSGMKWMIWLCMLPFLGYLLFIKKYLRR